MHNFIQEIGIAFLVATVIGLVTHKIKQPIILGYFIAGVILGPEIGPSLVSNPANIEIISEIGLILLLFVIGLEMDITKIIKAGKQLLITGVGQFALCVIYGIIVFGSLGYSLTGQSLDGLYLSLLCALSSTAIVVKLLYDKMELDTLPGRMSLGILILQDIWAVLILAFQPNFSHPAISLFGIALLKCIILLGVSFLLSKFVLSRIFQGIAKSPELVIVTSIGWCTFGAGFAGYLELSTAMGALIFGIAISAFPYSSFVCSKVLPLRDFFMILFFVSLGMKIPYPTSSLLISSIILGLFILSTRFLSVYPLLWLTGSGKRTAFISSLNLSQLSEFSLVIATLGVSYGHIDKKLVGLLIYTMAFTGIASSYLIQFNHQIFINIGYILKRFGIKSNDTKNIETSIHGKKFPIFILGFHRGAKAFIEELSRENSELIKKILVVDFNPEMLKEISSHGVEGIYGDISHIETLEHANIQNAKVILSTIPDMLLKGINNASLVKICRSLNPTAYIVATADLSTQAQELIKLGASEVILPHSLSGKYLVPIVKNNL